MPVDDRSMLALFDRVEIYATEGWKIPAAEVAAETVRELSKRGLDADGTPFPAAGDYGSNDPGHVYSKSHERARMRLGLDVETKNLTMGRLGLLPALKPRRSGDNVILAVADSPEEKLNKVAHGQMYHKDWKYHHKFLANGRIMMERVMAAIGIPLSRRGKLL